MTTGTKTLWDRESINTLVEGVEEDRDVTLEGIGRVNFGFGWCEIRATVKDTGKRWNEKRYLK